MALSQFGAMNKRCVYFEIATEKRQVARTAAERPSPLLGAPLQKEIQVMNHFPGAACKSKLSFCYYHVKDPQ